MNQLILLSAFLILPSFVSLIKNGGRIKLGAVQTDFVDKSILFLIFIYIGMAISTLSGLASAGFWLFYSVGLFLAYRKNLLRIKPSALRQVMIYLLFCVLTLALNSSFFSRSLKGIGTNINIIVGPITYLVIMRIRDEKPICDRNLEKLFAVISYLGIVAVLLAWIQGYNNILRVFRGMNPYHARASGFFLNKNSYGIFVALSLCPDLYMLFSKKNIAKLRWYIRIGIKLVAVIVSFSRAALLATGIFGLSFVWFNRRHKDYEFFVVSILALAAGIVVLWSGKLQRFFTGAVIRTDFGDAGRSYLFNRALSLFFEQSFLTVLLFGVGYFGIDSLGIDIDSTYLYLLFSGGLFKFLIFAVLAICSFKWIFALKKVNLLLGKLCLSVALSYYVYAFFESVTFMEIGLQHFLFTWFLFFIPAGYSKCALDTDGIKKTSK